MTRNDMLFWINLAGVVINRDSWLSENRRPHQEQRMSDLQPGPCVVCGLRNYGLSYGGPTICPGCDVGILT